MRALADSVTATGTATGDNASAGVEITSIPAASLPAGMYQLDIYSQTPTIANASVSNNVEIKAGSSSLVKVMFHIVAQNSGAYGPKQPLTIYRRLDGRTKISANFIANFAATETQAWIVTLVATKIGP